MASIQKKQGKNMKERVAEAKVVPSNKVAICCQLSQMFSFSNLTSILSGKSSD